MLLFIEHDAVMATAEACKALADFVGHRPGINLAVFHAADESDDDVLAAYPAALRERLLLTPQTPRARDLCSGWPTRQAASGPPCAATASSPSAKPG